MLAEPGILPIVRNTPGNEESVERFNTSIRPRTTITNVAVVRPNIKPNRQLARVFRVLGEPDWIVLIKVVPIVDE